MRLKNLKKLSPGRVVPDVSARAPESRLVKRDLEKRDEKQLHALRIRTDNLKIAQNSQ